MTDLKLCKDCKWYKKSWIEHLIFGNDADDKCFHPVLSGNLVTGKVKGGRVCSFMRLHGGGCGEEGKYFEPKNLIRTLEELAQGDSTRSPIGLLYSHKQPNR